MVLTMGSTSLSSPHDMQRIIPTLTTWSPQQNAGVGPQPQQCEHRRAIPATLRPKMICPQVIHRHGNPRRVARSEMGISAILNANGPSIYGPPPGARPSRPDVPTALNVSRSIASFNGPTASGHRDYATEGIYSSSQPSSSRALHITSCAFA
jgi:hypothetical protein